MQKKNRSIFIAALIILSAIICRAIGNLGILPSLLGLIRSFLYIGFYTAWGFSIRRRIIQKQVRRYMTAEAVLMIFWFSLRTAKYQFATDTVILRHIWYGYYIPMLFIPLLAVFIALSLGKPENYRLSKRSMLLFIPTLLLLFVVLTNDFHQLMFTFPGEIWSDADNGYGIACWFVLGWEIMCALTAFIAIVVKARIPGSRRIILLPLVPLAASILYGFLHMLKLPVVTLLTGDLTAVLCLLFCTIFETCIQCGLIQSNTGYNLIFPVSSVQAQITDEAYHVRYKSQQAAVLSENLLRATEQKAVHLDRNTVLKGHAIRGGHVIWQEDITELADAMEQLNSNKKDIAYSNEVERENYQVKKEINRLKEQNRLYDLIQSQTADSYELLKKILDEYSICEKDDERRRLLAKAAIVGAYIKRRGNLILLGENETHLPAKELQLCLNESIQNLELLDIKCECTIKLDIPLSTQFIMRTYDLFERIVESSADTLDGLWICLAKHDDDVIARIEATTCTDIESLADSGTEYFSGEDGSHIFILRYKEGEDI